MYYLKNEKLESDDLKKILKKRISPIFIFSDKSLVDSVEKIKKIQENVEKIIQECEKLKINWLKGIIIDGTFESSTKIETLFTVSENITEISGIVLFDKKLIDENDLVKSVKNDIINNNSLYISFENKQKVILKDIIRHTKRLGFGKKF